MVDLKHIILNTPIESLESIISPFIQEQFPSFVKSDYRKLILLIKAYYEWSEKQDNPGFVVSNLDSIYDIDTSFDEFYSHFKNTYLEGFPDILAVNISGETPSKTTLLKQIRDFYGNKGTQSAFEFFFRVLYDSEVEIYYPKEDILKASDGKWIEPLSVKSTTVNGNDLFAGAGGKLYQYAGDAVVGSANIDYVIQYNDNGLPITEYFISDLVGNFTPNNEISIENGDNIFTERLYSVLGDYFIETPGENFSVGDSVLIQDANGRGAVASIEQVGLGGTVKKITIKSSGINYINKVYVSFIGQKGENTSAVVYFAPTAITKYPGYFSSNRGKLSSPKKIQDGNYYQDFSYELKTRVDFEKYFSVLNQLLHPAGLRAFGSILIKSTLQTSNSTISEYMDFKTPIIGNYTPYTTISFVNLRNNGYVGDTGSWGGISGDLYPFGYNPYIGSTSQIGPNGKTTSEGTLFQWTNLGYTYCVMDEWGITSHNPIGAPLGSTSSWYSGAESTITPASIPGLVCWLKPENLLGANGTSADGISLASWTDASGNGNNLVAPTWDRWNPSIVYARKISTGGTWSQSLWNTNPVKKITFRTGIYGNTVSGVSSSGFTISGYTQGYAANLKIVGLWALGGTGPLGTGGNVSNKGYDRLDYSFYTETGNTNGIASLKIYESGISLSTSLAHTENTVFGLEHDTDRQSIVYTVDGIPVRTVGSVSASTDFYFDSSFYNNKNESLEVLGANLTSYVNDSAIYSDSTEVLQTDSLSDTVYYPMKSFTVSSSGNYKVKFTARIQTGSKWFAWKLVRTRDGQATDYTTSTYSNNLDTGQIASVHEYRRFVAYIYDAAPNDVYTLQMAVTENGGTTPVNGASAQTLYAKDLIVYKRNYTSTKVSPDGWTSTSGMTFTVIDGYTAWGMAPTIKKNDGGVAGCDGLYFNGDLSFGPWSTIHPSESATRNWMTGLTVWSDSSGVAANTLQYLNNNYQDYKYNRYHTVRIGRTAASYSLYFMNSSMAPEQSALQPNTELSTDWVFSAYLRREDGNSGITSATSGMWLYLGTNLNSVAFSANDPRVVTENVGNGWFRFQFGATAAGATYCWLGGFYGISAGMTLYVSGAQVEKKYRASPNVLPPNGIGTGVSFGSLPYVPFMPNTNTALALRASTAFLKNGLSVPSQADMFIVYRQHQDSYSYGSGLALLSSNRTMYDSYWSNSQPWDHVIFDRPYNSIDKTYGLNSSYHIFGGDGVWRYPAQIVGVAGFRPIGGHISRTVVDNRTVVYDPHVSSYHVGTSIVECTRDANFVCRSYYNGDEGLNYSRSTGLYVNDVLSGASTNAPIGFTFDLPIILGRMGSYIRGNATSSSGGIFATVGTTAWAQQTNPTTYSFNGVINEVLVFNRKLEETERQNVYGYLSRKYKLDAKLPDSFYASHPSTQVYGVTYWAINPHPNSYGLSSIPFGTPFYGITLQKFYSLPYQYYRGSTLPSEFDTYDTIPFGD